MANTVNTVITTGGGDYSSLAAAEAAIQSNSYSAGETATINCSGTSADTTAVVIDGWDMNVRIIINGDWDGDKYDTSKYRLEVSGYVFTSYRRFSMNRIQIKTTNQRCVDVGPYLTDTTYIDRCFFWAGADYSRSLYINDDSNVYVSNCIIYGISYSGDGIIKTAQGGSGTIYLDNLSIVGSGSNSIGTGIAIGSNTVVVARNILFQDCATDAANSGTFTDTYCATDNDNTKGLTAAGTGNRFSQTFTFTSTTPTTTGFLHLASDDAGARDYGTSTVSGSFTTDIDGQTRSGTWDIGADEYVNPGKYYTFLFKDYNNSVTPGAVTWTGQSSKPCSTNPCYLQIYNETTDTWVTIDSDSTTAAWTDFTLTGQFPISGTTESDFFTSGNHINCRVYQLL